VSRLLKCCAVLAGLAIAADLACAAGLDAAARLQVEQIVDAQIAAGRIPGAVVVMGDAGHVFYREAFGQRTLAPTAEAMTLDTEFDLASLTKVIATTTVVLQLAETGRLRLDASVAEYWPAFAANGKQDVTVRQLLAHTSGLRADLRAHPASPGRDGVLSAIAAEHLLSEPGQRVIYSDLNFVVLGELVQRVTHQSLGTYCEAHVFAPLGMRDTVFLPNASRAARSAATTADLAGMRRGLVSEVCGRGRGQGHPRFEPRGRY
jgi:CubicO group peptidase (beta-lactamase class C family)